MDEILKVHNLVKHYKNIKAVNGLSFTVNRGEIFGLLGPNGSGKSTTLRILLSLVYPDSGTVSLFGEQQANKNFRIRKKIGALIESPDFYNYLTAFKNLELLSRISGKKINAETIRQKLDWVGLKEYSDDPVRIFSHGMRQRLGIAQALIHDPELIILDEPANGLDPHGVIGIRNIILKLSREQGITIVLSSHILKEIELMADRMAVVHHGETVAEGKVTELLDGKNPTLKISVNDPEIAISVLKLNGITEIRSSETGELILNPAAMSPGLLNAVLVKAGVIVSSLVTVRSLEDYYLQITQNALENNLR